jgi:hypothetical protein
VAPSRTASAGSGKVEWRRCGSPDQPPGRYGDNVGHAAAPDKHLPPTQIARMVFSLILLVLMMGALGVLVRALLLMWHVKRVATGGRTPMVFSARSVAVTVGDTLVLALGGGRWGARQPPPAGRALAIGRTTLHVDAGRVRRRVEGRTCLERGLLLVTDRRVTWRGDASTIDVPLGDVAHLEVRGSLLEVRRHAFPSDPIVLSVPQPVSVAQVIAVLAAQAMGRQVTLTPTRP